jgi:hypothetical protein
LNVGAGGSFSIEGWIKPNGVASEQPIVEWSSTYFDVHMWIAVNTPGCLYGNLRDIVGGDHVITSAGNVIQAGKYQHVALTYNQASGSAALYMNGVSVAQANLGVFTPQTSADLYLGYRPHGGAAGTRFAGQMDEISIYNRALSANEVATLYQAGASGKCFTPAPPTITAQPTNQTASVGGAATFSVIVSGTPPLSYQWVFNETNSIKGATNSSLSLFNVSLTNAGSYSVAITSPYGSATSSNATLTVLSFPPTIQSQPNSQTAILGGTVTFIVVAAGSPPLSYQWFFNTTNLIGSGTNSSLLLSSLQFTNAGNYSVTVTNPGCTAQIVGEF